MNSFGPRYLARQQFMTAQSADQERMARQKRFEMRHIILGVIGGCCAVIVSISRLLRHDVISACLMGLFAAVYGVLTFRRYRDFTRKYENQP